MYNSIFHSYIGHSQVPGSKFRDLRYDDVRSIGTFGHMWKGQARENLGHEGEKMHQNNERSHQYSFFIGYFRT